jgi:ABC-type multidrug transport system ATPase subunit
MNILLRNISKRYQKNWIFSNISYEFSSPGKYAVLGANGSGKSTLMRIVSGMQSPSAGKIVFKVGGKTVEPSRVFRYLSYCAPGQELVEEFTLREALEFHFGFKPLLPGISVADVIDKCSLQQSVDKPIADYSSGMKQRVKLAQAIFADTPLLLLDEPCTNLDQRGVELYRDWMESYTSDRLVIVASNDVREYYLCESRLELTGSKNALA